MNRLAQVKDVKIEIRIYDSDIVEDRNLHHQCFRPENLGIHKVVAVFEELRQFNNEHVRIVPCAWDVRTESDLSYSDIAIVAVDSTPARRLVIGSSKAKVGDMHVCGRLIPIRRRDSEQASNRLGYEPESGSSIMPDTRGNLER